jgi:uncharacterized membrane protein YdjX (TVP38/TMEM64 family)
MASPRGSGSWRVPVALAVLVALLLLARELPVARLRDGLAALGPWGPAALAGVYLVAPLLMIPGSALTLLAGALFGVPIGLLAVLPAATAGATLAFLAGRYLLRERVARRVGGHPRLLALDEAVAGQGFRIVLLLRLSPLFPFNLLNYALGLTRVTLRDYVLASFIGMAPGALMYVYLGAAAGAAAGVESRPRSTAEWALFGVGLAATVAVALLVARAARRALERAAPGSTR